MSFGFELAKRQPGHSNASIAIVSPIIGQGADRAENFAELAWGEADFVKDCKGTS